MINSFNIIPKKFVVKWQYIADLLAKIINVPAALIMKTENEFMEVFISSNSENNPYNPGDKEHWHGLYCETVIKSQNELLVPNALNDQNWDKNPDIKLGMIAYLGIPLNFPNKKTFGSICVLDKKENNFSPENKELLYQFKNVIELDLALIQTLDWNNSNEDSDITQKQQAQNEEYFAVIEELKVKNEEYYTLYEEYKTQNEELFNAKEKAEESERTIKHSHYLMQYIIEHSRSAIAVHDKDFKYIYVSNRYLEEYKVKEKDILGKHHYEVFPDLPQKWRDVHIKALAGEVTSAEDDPYFKDDGTLEWTRWECRPWYEKDNSIGGFIVYTEVITERKNMELELLAAKEKAEESNHLKTEFLNNMSHEIRTPMNGIIGFSRMLDKPNVSDEKRKYFSKIVQNSSYQLLHIIDDILEISTLETKQERLIETEFSLNDLLMELFSIFNLKSKVLNIPLYLKKALHDNQSHIFSDKTKLNKILSNLLENALKFTSEGFVELGYYLDKTNLILYVKDTGIGISPQNHEIVFERFSQEDKEISKKHGGLGLGLSICKKNAQLIGGDITLESEKGKGSTFFLTIPYKPAQTLNYNTNKNFSSSKKINDSYTILVAEDEEVNYLYIEVLFEDEIDGNYKVIQAKNGKEAVEICMNNIIDLVLMDIKMPIMNGHEAAKKIKELFPELPIIAQTAYSTEADRDLALKYGCNDFISKPIDREKLFALMSKYLINN